MKYNDASEPRSCIMGKKEIRMIRTLTVPLRQLLKY